MTDENKQFQIGQVIYVLSEKAEAIVPGIIVEEQVVKKLDGHSISWKMQIGPPNKKHIISSEEIEGEIYTSLEDIRNVMTERIRNYVESQIKKAETRTEHWYGKQLSQVSNQQTEGQKEGATKFDPASLISSIDSEENDLFVQKPDQQNNNQTQQQNAGQEGTYRVKNEGPVRPSGNINTAAGDPHSSLRERLKEMATPEEEDTEEAGPDGEKQAVRMDDGRVVPVSINSNPKE